jgi:DNA invertase Pin-like site-specific DNA recombinase
MPSTNGHGPKRAILYARVSTKKQAEEDHYSLPQQLEALREYASREGYDTSLRRSRTRVTAERDWNGPA